MATGRWARIAAAATLLAVSPGSAAAGPPPVDDTRLPTPARPAPARATVQREVCAVPGFDARRAGPPGQLDGLDLAAVWPLSRGAGQRVAVIDTGVARHRRLPRLVGGGDYVADGDGTLDCDGHGTVVAGIIAAAPDPAADGFSGVAPEATVLTIRQSSAKFGAADDPTRTGVGDVDTLARAVRTAADLGASVINVSSVACAPAGAAFDDRALGAALAYAVDVKRAVVVAAAGNSGDGGPCPAPDDEAGRRAAMVVSPAWYDDYVLTVASVDATGAPSAFTTPGRWVDVAAPGEGVLSLGPVGDAMANSWPQHRGSTPIAGTSYAAPVVSGLAALIRSRFPDWSPRQVMQRIRTTAHHPPGGRNDLVGAGVVDPAAAVSAGPPADTAAGEAPVPIAAPAVRLAEPSGRGVALGGAAALFGVLALAVAVGRISRRRAGRVAGD